MSLSDPGSNQWVKRRTVVRGASLKYYCEGTGTHMRKKTSRNTRWLYVIQLYAALAVHGYSNDA